LVECFFPQYPSASRGSEGWSSCGLEAYCPLTVDRPESGSRFPLRTLASALTTPFFSVFLQYIPRAALLRSCAEAEHTNPFHSRLNFILHAFAPPSRFFLTARQPVLSGGPPISVASPLCCDQLLGETTFFFWRSFWRVPLRPWFFQIFLLRPGPKSFLCPPQKKMIWLQRFCISGLSGTREKLWLF